MKTFDDIGILKKIQGNHKKNNGSPPLDPPFPSEESHITRLKTEVFSQKNPTAQTEDESKTSELGRLGKPYKSYHQKCVKLKHETLNTTIAIETNSKGYTTKKCITENSSTTNI